MSIAEGVGAQVACLAFIAGGGAACSPTNAITLPELAPDLAPDLAPELAIGWPVTQDGGKDPVVFLGLPGEILAELESAQGDRARLAQIIAVRVDSEGEPPPIAGDLRIVDDAVLFEPRFSWTPGLAYRAEMRSGKAEITSVHAFTKEELEPSSLVRAVYPSADVLPENLLRLYLHFTAPMSRGEARQRVHILNEEGNELPGTFLWPAELWDPKTTRLTLLLDPGRIKRGLVPHEELGAPLKTGEQYTLVVDADWRDARGVPLARGFRHEFRTETADRECPDVANWELEAPRAGTRDALVVRFAEPLDHALLQRMLSVTNDAGLVAGSIAISDSETAWSFVPTASWSEGDHELIADPLLEDRAGNSLERAFEVDLRASREQPSDSTYRRTFRARGFEQGS